jgi:hypothetical protein
MTSLSSTVKAGRMLRLMAWLTLAFSLTALIALAIPALNSHSLPTVRPSVVAKFAFVVLYIPSCFIVGSALIRYASWARKAGIVASALSLVVFVPIGAVCGCLALWYLFRGWRETPDVSNSVEANAT